MELLGLNMPDNDGFATLASAQSLSQSILHPTPCMAACAWRIKYVKWQHSGISLVLEHHSCWMCVEMGKTD